MGSDLVVPGWDAREGWAALLVHLAAKVLACNKDEPLRWYECLSDYYNWACAVFGRRTRDDMSKHKNYLRRKKIIEDLLLAKSISTDGGKTYRALTEREKTNNKNSAYKLMEWFFRDINMDLWSRRVFMPLIMRRDVREAIKEVEN